MSDENNNEKTKEKNSVSNLKEFLFGISILLGTWLFYFLQNFLYELAFKNYKGTGFIRVYNPILVLVISFISFFIIIRSINHFKGHAWLIVYFIVLAFVCILYYNTVLQDLRASIHWSTIIVMLISSIGSVYYSLSIIVKKSIELFNQFINSEIDPKDKLTIVIALFSAIISLIALFK